MSAVEKHTVAQNNSGNVHRQETAAAGKLGQAVNQECSADAVYRVQSRIRQAGILEDIGGGAAEYKPGDYSQKHLVGKEKAQFAKTDLRFVDVRDGGKR